MHLLPLLKIKIRPMYKYPIFILFAATILFSCAKDDSTASEMEEEMEEVMSVNLTNTIIGTYIGTNKFSENGSFITESDKSAIVTMESDSVAKVDISSAFTGNILLSAKMMSEITFLTQDVTVLTEGPYAGSGTINGDTLFIELTSGDKRFDYIGVK